MTDIKHISGAVFSNEIGRVHASVKDMSIVPYEYENAGDIMAREKKQHKGKDDKNSTKPINQNVDKKAIDDIWKHMGLGHIDISYAFIGYSMDGRPILNHDEFVNLLINYGFKVQDVLSFIDDFAAHSTHDYKSPIVMFSSNTSAIMTNIEPIV